MILPLIVFDARREFEQWESNGRLAVGAQEVTSDAA
jgi:hypothetical protein